MGLLPYLNAHALDEDYAQAAARSYGIVPGKRRRIGRGGAAVLAVFAILAVTAAVQTNRDSASEEKERRALISQVSAGRDSVAKQRSSIASLLAENRRLETALLASHDDSTGVLGNLALLGLRSGTTPARGPGVEVVADDAPNATSDRQKVLDSDLQKLVNGLWHAGAEAISINGQRLTALSAIRFAGTAIAVNFVSLSPPYRVLAIGNPDTLPSRFLASTSGQTWLDLKSQIGLKFSMKTQTSLRLPGRAVPSLRYIEHEEPAKRKETP